MPKFDFKEHERRMREIMATPATPQTSPLFDKIKGLGKRKGMKPISPLKRIPRI